MMRSYIGELLLRLCSQPRSFDFLASSLSGQDPREIRAELDVLLNGGELRRVGEYYFVQRGSSQKHLSFDLRSQPHVLLEFMGHYDYLKTPHPLDFEWRNTPGSISNLVNVIRSTHTNQDRVLILGMPTLFSAVASANLGLDVTLIERNGPVIDGLARFTRPNARALKADIYNVVPAQLGLFDAVYMDPPWYTPFYEHFCWVAANCLKLTGRLTVSIPPLNTRPSIPRERVEWITYAHGNGLCIEALSPNVMEYATPFFEFNANRAAGLEGVGPFWRKGDLLTFRKKERGTLERPEHREESRGWREVEVNGTRFRISERSNDGVTSTGLPIQSILEGDILPSVSNRDPRRKEASIWTTGNRVFACSDPTRVMAALNDYVRKGSCESDLHEWIETITGLESKEYETYLGWIYDEMERSG